MEIAEFIDWCQHNGISCTISFNEGSSDETTREFEVETISPAPSECYYVKRCYNFQEVVDNVNRQIKEEVEKENG